jgi:hypothetical protein
MKTSALNPSKFSVNPLKSVAAEKTKETKSVYLLNMLKSYKPFDNTKAKVLPLILNYSNQSAAKTIVKNITDDLEKLDTSWFLNYE